MLKRVGRLTPADAEQVAQSLRQWFRARVDRPGVGTRAQGRAMTLSGEPAEHDSGADGPPHRLFPHTGVSGVWPLGIKLTGFEYGNRSFMYHRDIPSM